MFSEPVQSFVGSAVSFAGSTVTGTLIANVSGGLFANCKPVTLSGPAADAALAKSLWDASVRLGPGTRERRERARFVGWDTALSGWVPQLSPGCWCLPQASLTRPASK